MPMTKSSTSGERRTGNMGFIKYLFKRISIKKILIGVGEFLAISALATLLLGVPLVSLVLVIALLIWSGSFMAIDTDTTFFTEQIERQFTFKESITISMGISSVLFLISFMLVIIYIVFGEWVKTIYFDYRKEKEYEQNREGL